MNLECRLVDRPVFVTGADGFIGSYLVGFEAQVTWDVSKPDGQPQRRLDISRAEGIIDWEPKFVLNEGL